LRQIDTLDIGAERRTGRPHLDQIRCHLCHSLQFDTLWDDPSLAAPHPPADAGPALSPLTQGEGFDRVLPRAACGERAGVRGRLASVELHADGFGDEGGSGGALDLDRVLRSDTHTPFDRLDGFDLLAQPDARAGLHLSREPYAIGPVIEPPRA